MLWLLCAVLILAVFALAVDTLVPRIEHDLKSRSTRALSGTGITADNIEVDGQDVFLKGEIDSSPLREEAGKIVASVTGVRTVSNSLNLANNEVEAVTEPATDSAAATEISAPNTASLDISVEAEQVLVAGTLSSQGEIDRVGQALAGKFGADRLDNQLRIDADAKPVWLDSAIAMIDQLDNIQNPGLTLADGVAKLSGDVSSETLGAQKVAMAQRLFGSDVEVQSSVTIRQPTTSGSRSSNSASNETNKRPGSLKLTNEGGRQVLSGVVGSQQELGDIINLAQDIYKPSALEIAINVDESVAPIQWAESLFTVAADLKDVDNLGLSVNSGQLVLSGDVDSRDAAENIKASVREKMDDSLDVIDTFDVRPPTATASSMAIQAPWAMYCIMGWAASPSNTTS